MIAALAGGVLSKGLIAFAGQHLKGFKIDDLDGASGITDGAARLYPAGNLGNGGAPDTEHLGEEFLGEIERVAFRAIPRLQ